MDKHCNLPVAAGESIFKCLPVGTNIVINKHKYFYLFSKYINLIIKTKLTK